ncbi:MAG: hypothetical protein KR126chlam1_01389 [Chlamydiae bacterium]|nr:hypothetical protein [Chlamydiota bacterium]
MNNIQAVQKPEHSFVASKSSPIKEVWEGDGNIVFRIMNVVAIFFSQIFNSIYYTIFSAPETMKKPTTKAVPPVGMDASRPPPASIVESTPATTLSLKDRCSQLTAAISKAQTQARMYATKAFELGKQHVSRLAPLAIPMLQRLPYGDYIPGVLFPVAASIPIGYDMCREFRAHSPKEGTLGERLQVSMKEIASRRESQFSLGIIALALAPYMRSLSATLRALTPFNASTAENVATAKSSITVGSIFANSFLNYGH